MVGHVPFWQLAFPRSGYKGFQAGDIQEPHGCNQRRTGLDESQRRRRLCEAFDAAERKAIQEATDAIKTGLPLLVKKTYKHLAAARRKANIKRYGKPDAFKVKK